MRYWLHTAMVRHEGEKMSKSLGNLVMVSDLLKTCSPDALRLYLADHHYREPWSYDEGELESRAAGRRAELRAAEARSDCGRRGDARSTPTDAALDPKEAEAAGAMDRGSGQPARVGGSGGPGSKHPGSADGPEWTCTRRRKRCAHGWGLRLASCGLPRVLQGWRLNPEGTLFVRSAGNRHSVDVSLLARLVERSLDGLTDGRRALQVKASGRRRQRIWICLQNRPAQVYNA